MEGYPPLFDDGMSPDKLGIRKQKNAKLHLPVDTPSDPFFSVIPLEQLWELQDSPNALAFFQTLGYNEAPNRLDVTKLTPSEVRKIDAMLKSARIDNLKLPDDNEEGLALYRPESRNSGSPEENEEIILDLDKYVLRKNGTAYPDLRRLRDICLAQKLYSKYYNATPGAQKQFWHFDRAHPVSLNVK